MSAKDDHGLAGEMRDIKILLILQVMALGYQQKHVAAALGVSEATLSRMLPKGLGKGIARSIGGRAGRPDGK